MNRKSLFFLFAVSIIYVNASSQEFHQPVAHAEQGSKSLDAVAFGQVTKEHKIVFQLASNDTLVWKGLMNNLQNLKEGWGDNVSMAVVAHGPGIELLMKNKTTQHEAIKRFLKKGIEFIACENTMKQKKIKAEEIIPEATFVIMGIGEIVERQEKGWTYIKAGF